MSSCAVNRWGPGTTKERPPNTELSKEIEVRMAEMTRIRNTQDTIWTNKPESPELEKNKANLSTSTSTSK